jgi:hypothetical protein
MRVEIRTVAVSPRLDLEQVLRGNRLMSYGASQPEPVRCSGNVLDGAKFAELPTLRPGNFGFAPSTAEALDITPHVVRAEIV